MTALVESFREATRNPYDEASQFVTSQGFMARISTRNDINLRVILDPSASNPQNILV
jgi:hypothetical protein